MSTEFHRHCQATVLSASGPVGGEGATWSTLSVLVPSLTNLPNNWIDYYQSNTDNITGDFAATLKIMNQICETQNEIQGSMDDVVYKSIDQTISGRKTFNKGLKHNRNATNLQAINTLKITDFDFLRGEYPPISFLRVFDKNDREIVTEHYSDGNRNINKVCREVRCYHDIGTSVISGRTLFTDTLRWNDTTQKFDAELVYSVTDDGDNSTTNNKNVTASTNSTTSNALATKGWVNNPETSTNVVHKTGVETIEGAKTFNNSGSITIQKAAGFNYSGMEAGTTDTSRNVWFSRAGDDRGIPVYDNDFKYNPGSKTLSVNKLGSGVQLASSPAEGASGREVVDAEWVDRKIRNEITALNLYSPPATLSTICVYMHPEGNDSQALTNFKAYIGLKELTAKDQYEKLYCHPFKTLSNAIQALNLVRSTRSGFNFCIYVLPGEYTMKSRYQSDRSSANIQSGCYIRHPDCNSFSGIKLIVKGIVGGAENNITDASTNSEINAALSAAQADAPRDTVKFMFDDPVTVRGDSGFGTQLVFLYMYYSSIRNIRFIQSGVNWHMSSTTHEPDPEEYSSPCTGPQINSNATVLIQTVTGGNSIINCECFCQPAQDSNYAWRSYIFLLSSNTDNSFQIYSIGDYFRQKKWENENTFEIKKEAGVDKIFGHRCCFYGLNDFAYITAGGLFDSWNTFDAYFYNCRNVFLLGDAQEAGATMSFWVNHTGDAQTYVAMEAVDVQHIFGMDNNTTVLMRSDKYQNGINVTDGEPRDKIFYNPLCVDPSVTATNQIFIVKVSNSPPSSYSFCSVADFNSRIIPNTDVNNLGRLSANYDKLFKAYFWYTLVPPPTPTP